jgi:hypothetical protein
LLNRTPRHGIDQWWIRVVSNISHPGNKGITATNVPIYGGHVLSDTNDVLYIKIALVTVLVEEGMVIVYHCMDNAREMHGAAIQPLEFELDDGPAIEMLLEAYPAGVLVQDLPHASEELEDKVGVAQALFKEGFMMIVDSVSREDGDDDDNDDPF